MSDDASLRNVIRHETSNRPSLVPNTVENPTLLNIEAKEALDMDHLIFCDAVHVSPGKANVIASRLDCIFELFHCENRSVSGVIAFSVVGLNPPGYKPLQCKDS